MAKGLMNITVNAGTSLERLQLINNLNLFGAYLTANTAKSLGYIVTHLLKESQLRVPYDIGELSGSGKGNIMFRGKYRYALDIKDYTDISKITKNKRLMSHGISEIIGEVRYQKENEWGEDIALWAHEDLLPYIKREIPNSTPTGPIDPNVDYKSRIQGRGPKYLEGPYLENIHKYMYLLYSNLSPSAINRQLKAGTKVTKKGKDKYEADLVKINEAILDSQLMNKLD